MSLSYNTQPALGTGAVKSAVTKQRNVILNLFLMKSTTAHVQKHNPLHTIHNNRNNRNIEEKDKPSPSSDLKKNTSHLLSAVIIPPYAKLFMFTH